MRSFPLTRGGFSKRRAQQLRTVFRDKVRMAGQHSGHGPTQKGAARSVVLGNGISSRIVPEENC